MVAVFQLDIPATQKLVLLAMADHAHDDGTRCYPSIGRLARRTSLSIRGVQTTMRRLEKAGFIVPQGKSKGGSGVTTEYNLTLQQSGTRALAAGSESTRKTAENPAPGAPISGGEALHREDNNPAPQCSQTPHVTAEVSAAGAPEPSGTNCRNKIGIGCANTGRRQDAETRGPSVVATSTAFSALGFNRPFGHRAFKLAVGRRSQGLKNASLLEVMEGVIQDCDGKVPPQFYEAKHALEDDSRMTEAQRESRVGTNGRASPMDLFPRDQLAAYLINNAERIERVAERITPQQPKLASECSEITKTLRSSLTLLDAPALDLEEFERRMSLLDGELLAVLIRYADEKLVFNIQRESAKALAVYRRKMRGDQLACLERQQIHKRLLDAFELPRMSLYYFE
jgi:hypothetical protein